jgi:hypothetical protein
MTIKHKTTRNITEYHFELTPTEPPHTFDFPKYTDTLGKVVIVFENGKFSRCDFPFRGTYTREQWSMLAEIESEIHRIELSLLKQKP